jgi:hypothetical protein
MPQKYAYSLLVAQGTRPAPKGGAGEEPFSTDQKPAESEKTTMDPEICEPFLVEEKLGLR